MTVTEPTDQPPDPDSAPAMRLAVFEMTGAEKAHLGTITISKSGDDEWTVECAADSDAVISRVRPALDQFGANRRAAAGTGAAKAPSATPDVGALADLLRQEGFHVEELPAGDYQIDIQLDLNTGSLVGAQAAMHALAASDNPLGRRIVDAIAQSFTKGSDDLAIEVDALIDQNEVDAALQAIKRDAEKGVFSLPPTSKLLNALVRLDVSGFSPEDRRLIRDARLGVAHRLGRFEIAGKDADALLAEDAATLSSEQIASLRMVVALSAIKRGSPETGLSILYELVKEPTALDAEGRGWAWRNISMTLNPGDPEARRANQLSADAFLEAGNKHEAGKSLMGLVNILMEDDPAKAVTMLNEMIALLDKESLLDRRVRAAALHARANRLARLNMHADAFRDASEAVALSRGLIGIEVEFVSSLHLAAIEACHIGDTAAAGAFEDEAEKLTEELKLSHFQLAQRISALGQAFDPKVADDLLQDAKAADNLEIIVAVRVFQATRDTSLSDTARLELLEGIRSRIIAARDRTGMMKPVQIALGQQLARMGQPRRAEKWFREILAADSLDGFPRFPCK